MQQFNDKNKTFRVHIVGFFAFSLSLCVRTICHSTAIFFFFFCIDELKAILWRLIRNYQSYHRRTDRRRLIGNYTKLIAFPLTDTYTKQILENQFTAIKKQRIKKTKIESRKKEEEKRFGSEKKKQEEKVKGGKKKGDSQRMDRIGKGKGGQKRQAEERMDRTNRQSKGWREQTE